MADGPTDLARRPPRREDPIRVPEPVAGSGGLLVVDSSWGSIYPLVLADGVETVAELELIEHARRGLPVFDTRPAEAHSLLTIPGARSLPHAEVSERHAELGPARPTVLFCNGPQCAATPDAIRKLLDRGHHAASLLYYRGGLHDWMTLGLPVAPGSPAGRDSSEEGNS